MNSNSIRRTTSTLTVEFDSNLVRSGIVSIPRSSDLLEKNSSYPAVLPSGTLIGNALIKGNQGIIDIREVLTYLQDELRSGELFSIGLEDSRLVITLFPGEDSSRPRRLPTRDGKSRNTRNGISDTIPSDGEYISFDETENLSIDQKRLESFVGSQHFTDVTHENVLGVC